MPSAVYIPKASITMEDARILGWRKQPGDVVQKDDILFEIETDKVVLEVPAPTSGVLLRIDVPQGLARLDDPVAWIGEPDDELPQAIGGTKTIMQNPFVTPVETGRNSGGMVSASPAARRLARELGIDVSSIRGTGPGGRVTEADVDRARGAL